MTTPEPGLRRQVMSWTRDLMLVRHTMEAGWVGAKHSHPHEQLIYIVSGHIILTTPTGTIHLHTGDSTIVPGGMEHQASAPVPCEVLDVFNPYREDYA
jgi:quercetin dioxygenase-like cupin family protein